MDSKERVMKWVKETFNDLSEVTIEDYDRLPCGKKIFRESALFLSIDIRKRLFKI